MSTFSQTRQDVTRLLGAPALEAALDILLTDKERMRFEAARRRVAEEEFVVAVIGRQGVGKSSLMNALLFGERVLPIDETETTNVICRIRSADERGERAVVRFADGTEEEGPLTDEFLRGFTDEQENPGNMLGVTEVIGYHRSPLLASGITLVDTPGVGSMTESAGQVTFDFLPRISLGLFLIGTVPTLLDSESLFLRASWAHSQHFIFVQNAWSDDPTQLEMAIAENRRRLGAIAAEEAGSDEVMLKVVDVHQGLEGVCNGRPELIASSGLADLADELRRRVEGGAGRLLLLTNGSLLVAILREAARGADMRIQAIDARAATTQENFDAALGEAQDDLMRLSQEWAGLKLQFVQQCQRLYGALYADLERAIDQAVEDTIVLAKARTIDADRLGQAASDNLMAAAKKVSNQLQQDFTEAVKDFLARAQRLMLELQELSFKVAFSGDVKFSEGAGAAAGLASGAGFLTLSVLAGTGITAFGAALFAGAGFAGAVAAGGAAIAAVPGIGWVIGGGLVIGGLLGKAWFDGKALQGIERELKKSARSFREEVQDKTLAALRAHEAKVLGLLDEQFQASMAQQQANLDALRSDRRKSTEEAEAIKTELKAHRLLLGESVIRLEAAMALAEKEEVPA